ncbi:MAG TPA: tetratricopeptide repeat protein [Aggregatilineales bacterium]|nr:tetratricopeptide repeat protein [Anaerolineales bacterium]HRE46339.1 tetratricopeptide repeat protein [Aggregatilineales bacterium]
MYLNTPKRYRKTRRRLFNFRWLWLYILFPVIIIPAMLLWQFRGQISGDVGRWVERNIKFNVNPPTPTATIPAVDLQTRLVSYIQSGNMKNAISTLTSLASARPNDLDAYTRLTKMILFRDDSPKAREEALRAAEGALNANPEAADGWIMVAMALNALDRPSEALPYLLRARDFDTRDPWLLAVLADTYDAIGRGSRALGLVEESLEAAKATAASQNGNNVVVIAYANVVKGKILLASSGEQAIRAFEEGWRVAQQDSQMPIGYIAQWLWSYYFNVNDFQKITDSLDLATARDKDDPINAYLLGRTYIKAGDPNRAIISLERCRDLDPDQVKCLRWLGTMMFRQENYQRAAELGLRAIELGTTDVGAYLVAGSALAYNGRCGEAVSVLQAGLNLAQTQGSSADWVAQFRDALRSCGAGNNVFATPTPGQ